MHFCQTTRPITKFGTLTIFYKLLFQNFFGKHKTIGEKDEYLQNHLSSMPLVI